uniref:MARVEL domain-containing protein n=1 Tax=Globodera pallida TaxID=36090 RepID=A0A183C8B8_GLOPA
MEAKSQNGEFTATSDEQLEDGQKFKCCFCLNAKIKKATLVVAVVSSFFIISNLIVKIIGYSEIGWNFELLFLFVDGVAVLSMIYGLYAENAAFLQPFVVLSIITISLMMLLAAYLGTAMVNSNSWASQELELELNKRLSDAAKRMKLEFKFSWSNAINIHQTKNI